MKKADALLQVVQSSISACNQRSEFQTSVRFYRLCLARLPQQVIAAPLTGRCLRLLRNRERRWTALHGLDDMLIITELPVSQGTGSLLPCSQESATGRYSDTVCTLKPYSDPASTLTP